MLRLITFGGLSLQRDGALEQSECAHRRRLALLAVLATAGGNAGAPVWRDKLLLLLWPESSETRARNSLKQLVFSTRRALSEDIILGTTDLRLNPVAITSDVGDFLDAAHRGDAEAAVAAYGGPFLDGVHIDEAAEFEQWAASERERLDRLHAQSLEQAALEATLAHEPARAIARLEARAALDPLDTRVALDLVRALAGGGDCARALRHAAAHEQLLSSELGITVDPSFRDAVAAMCRAAPAMLPAHAEVALSGKSAPMLKSSSGSAEHAGPRRRLVWRLPRKRWLVGTAAVLVLTAITAPRLLSHGPPTTDAIAVLPFSVVSAEPSLRYLRLGVAELLTRELQLDSVTRAVAAWTGRDRDILDPAALGTDALRDIARRAHCQHVVIGSVVGSPGHLVLQASLVTVEDSRSVAEASVDGPADSVAAMAQRLVAQLLALDAGVAPDEAREVSVFPLPAVRELLTANRLARMGRMDAAARHYEAALNYDSSFAYAALGLVRVTPGDPGASSGTLPRALALAWSARSTLAPRDLVVARAVVGPQYPNPSSMIDYLGAWRAAVTAAPDDPQTWFGLADVYFHDGDVLALPHPLASARAALEQALELDSTNTESVRHLVDIAAQRADRQTVERLSSRFLAADSTGPLADYLLWRRSTVLDDSSTRARKAPAIDTLPLLTLRWIVQAAIDAGAPVADAQRAVVARRAAGGTIAERRETLLAADALAIAEGRPRAGGRALAELRGLEPDDYADLRYPVLDALYAEGDSVAAAAAARDLIAHYALARPRARTDEESAALCVAAQWRLHLGDAAFARRAATTLGAMTAARSAVPTFCASLLTALTGATAAARGQALERLDATVSTGEPLQQEFSYAAIAGARLWAAAGRYDRALQLIRRRGNFGRWAYYLGPSLADEARYALAMADTNSAACALERLRALRLDPEGPVRAADARLERAVPGAGATARRARPADSRSAGLRTACTRRQAP